MQDASHRSMAFVGSLLQECDTHVPDWEICVGIAAMSRHIRSIGTAAAVRSNQSGGGSNRNTESVAGEAHGDAHAAADSKRGETLLGVALAHFVDQSGQDAGT